MAAGGDGLGKLGTGPGAGKVVFVGGVLPGEVVDVEVTLDKRDYAKAELRSVVERSAHRVEPPCAVRARGCGGCGWQFIEPAHQHVLKADVVRDALRRTARLDAVDVRLGAAVAPWAYRTSMRVAATTDGLLGLRHARSHQLVPLDECMVTHPLLASLLGELRVTGAGDVSLRVGAASGSRTVLPEPGVKVVSCPTDVRLGEQAFVVERVQGVDLRVSAGSFFQSGPAAAEALVDAVRRAVVDAVRVGHLVDPVPVGHLVDAPPIGHLVDAYGGVGLFSATVPAERVTLIESSASSCRDARVNLGSAGTVTEVTVERWGPAAADVVVADPSRQGLTPAALDRLCATNAPTFVLVSCDPVAMARDAAGLILRGYRIDYAEVLDLFPNTPHVEVVSRFRLPATEVSR
jgi:23S rRNA (uracil1939-C5)-methyltransferase